MTIQPSDFFRVIDLNVPPAAGGPINNPLDLRAMQYFGFLSNGQQLQLIDPLPIGNTVLFSFRYAQSPGIGPVPPFPQADGAVQFAGGGPFARYENSHDRAHVLVWVDGPALPAGLQCRVQVSAWSKT